MDKLVHFAFSAVIVFTITLVFKDILSAITVGIFVGIFKELIDKYILKTGWNIKDIYMDMLGIAYATIILIIA